MKRHLAQHVGRAVRQRTWTEVVKRKREVGRHVAREAKRQRPQIKAQRLQTTPWPFGMYS